MYENYLVGLVSRSVSREYFFWGFELRGETQGEVRYNFLTLSLVFSTKKTSPIEPSFIEIFDGVPLTINLTILLLPLLANLLNLTWKGLQLIVPSSFWMAITSIAPMGSWMIVVCGRGGEKKIDKHVFIHIAIFILDF